MPRVESHIISHLKVCLNKLFYISLLAMILQLISYVMEGHRGAHRQLRDVRGRRRSRLETQECSSSDGLAAADSPSHLFLSNRY